VLALLMCVACGQSSPMTGTRASGPARDDAEPVHAEAAKEMLHADDWADALRHGIRYLEKAPLMYWAWQRVTRCSESANGSTPPSRLMLGVLAMHSRARMGWDAGTFRQRRRIRIPPWCSAIVPPSGRFFLRDSLRRFPVRPWPDSDVLAFFGIAGANEALGWICWGLAAVCALTSSPKGLIGLVFPAGAIGLYLLLTGNLRFCSSCACFELARNLAIAAPIGNSTAETAQSPAGNVRGFLCSTSSIEHILAFS